MPAAIEVSGPEPGAPAARRPPAAVAPERVALAVFLCFAAVWRLGTKPGGESWNENSRLAGIESLVERGTFRIDDSPFAANTKDKVFIGGHYYCDKPPLFQVIGAPVYALLRRLGCVLSPDRSVPGAIAGYRWLTFAVVGVPSAGMLAGLTLWALRRGTSLARTLVVAGLTAFATSVWPYSLSLNNHLPAGAALLGCLLLSGSPATGEAGAARLFAAGLLGGAAAGFDLVAALPVAALSVVVLRHRGRALAFALGAALPLAVTLAADFMISGSPLPPYFVPHAFRFPGSPFYDTIAASRPPRDVGIYAFQGTIGDRGLLAYSPVLVLALAGLVRRFKSWRQPDAWASLALGLGIAAYVGYVFTHTDNHGGKAYGERYLVSIVAPLAFFGLYALQRASRSAALLALALTVPPSTLSAAQGVARTWTVTQPVIYLPTPPRLGLCSSLRDPDRPCWPQ